MKKEEKNAFTLDELSLILASTLPNEVTEYYSSSLSENQIAIEEYLADNWLTHINDPFNDAAKDLCKIETIIAYLLWKVFTYPTMTGSQPLTERAALEHYSLLKKNRKDYLYRTVQEEYVGKKKPRAPQYIEESWNAVNSPYLKNSNISCNLTKEEYYKQEFSLVSDWHSDSSSYIFNFPYFSAIKAQRRVACIIIDIAWCVFTKICKDYYRNRFGFITKSPDMVFGLNNLKQTNSPIINWQSSSISINDLSFEATDDTITIYEVLNSETEPQLRIIIDVIHNVDCSTPAKRNKELLQLKNDYINGKKIGHLDAMDFSIITAILNNMTYDIAVGRSDLIMTFNELAYDIIADDSKLTVKRCDDIFQRLLKIQKMNLVYYEHDKNGIPTMGEGLDFFKFKYVISGDYFKKGDRSRNNSSITISKTLDLSGEANITNIENLTKPHYNNMILQFTPSEYLKKQWITGTHTLISSRTYKQVTSQKGKLLLPILQQERLKIYPCLETNLSLMFIKMQIRTSSGHDGRFKKEIISELENLKESGIIIKDYTVNRSSFDIEFNPFNAEEKLMFKIHDTMAPPDNTLPDSY